MNNKEVDLSDAVEIFCSHCGKKMETGMVYYTNPMLYEYHCSVCNYKIRMGFKSCWFEVIDKDQPNENT